MIPFYRDQLFHSAADESQWLVSHLVNSPNANILSVFVQIRLTIARIPNGMGEARIAHMKENSPRYRQVLSCALA